MKTIYRLITAREVFERIKEWHRTDDFNPNHDFVFTMDTSVKEMIVELDIDEFNKNALADFLMVFFNFEADMQQWRNVLEPHKTKTVKDVCQFIAAHAKVEIVQPVKVCGSNCLSAALFKYFIRHLTSNGIDTKGIKPSSRLAPYLKEHYAIFFYSVISCFSGGVLTDIKRTKNFKPFNKAHLLFLVTGIISAYVGWQHGFDWFPAFGFTVISFVGFIISSKLQARHDFKHNYALEMQGMETFADLIKKVILEKKYILR